jgi:DNA sulfur modification protein DndB
MTSFEFELPAVRGIQAGQPYYLTACPLRLLSRLFPEGDSDSLSPGEPRLALNRGRVPEIARYVSDNPRSYVFGALTASVDCPVAFESSGDEESPVCSGRIRIPMSAKLVLHDGQHRCAGLKSALRDKPELGDEAIAIVLFVDPGLRRSEQVFTDLKRHERRLPRSLSILHDDRDEFARLARQVIRKVEVFGDNVEMVKTTISHRSRKLFTFSAIYQATRTLLARVGVLSYQDKLQAVVVFWSAVAEQIPAWQQAIEGQFSPSDLRKQYVHAHGIALAALARVGQSLLAGSSKNWQTKLRGLKTLDWSRSNSRLWEGRAMIAGRLSKASSCVGLTANAIKQHLGLPLTADEDELERQFKKRGRG